MIGLLFRVVVGVVTAAAVGGTAYAVYKCITKDNVKEEISNKLELEDNDVLKKAFNAKVKEKSQCSVKVYILDEMDEPLTEVDINGDEVSEDIHVGDVIVLRETF